MKKIINLFLAIVIVSSEFSTCIGTERQIRRRPTPTPRPTPKLSGAARRKPSPPAVALQVPQAPISRPVPSKPVISPAKKPQCTTDDQCTRYQVCEKGTCIALGKASRPRSCIANKDCPPTDYVCHNKQCKKFCKEDDDCKTGERCKQNCLCEVVKSCKTDRECGKGKCHEDGYCVECLDDNDCSSSKPACLDGSCLARCTVDKDCDKGQICISGSCTPSCICLTDQHCPTGQPCKTGYCTAPKAPSAVDLSWLTGASKDLFVRIAGTIGGTIGSTFAIAFGTKLIEKLRLRGTISEKTAEFLQSKIEDIASTKITKRLLDLQGKKIDFGKLANEIRDDFKDSLSELPKKELQPLIEQLAKDTGKPIAEIEALVKSRLTPDAINKISTETTAQIAQEVYQKLSQQAVDVLSQISKTPPTKPMYGFAAPKEPEKAIGYYENLRQQYKTLALDPRNTDAKRALMVIEKNLAQAKAQQAEALVEQQEKTLSALKEAAQSLPEGGVAYENIQTSVEEASTKLTEMQAEAYKARQAVLQAEQELDKEYGATSEEGEVISEIFGER